MGAMCHEMIALCGDLWVTRPETIILHIDIGYYSVCFGSLFTDLPYCNDLKN